MVYTSADIQKIFGGSQELNRMWSEIQDFFRIVGGIARSEISNDGYSLKIPLNLESEIMNSVVFTAEGSRITREGADLAPGAHWNLSEGQRPSMEVIPFLYHALPRILTVVMEQLLQTRQQLKFIMGFGKE